MDGVESSVNGVVIQNMILRRAAKECIRFRYFVTNSVVRLCDIRYCGVEDFQLGSKGENGEGVCEYWFDRKLQQPPGVACRAYPLFLLVVTCLVSGRYVVRSPRVLPVGTFVGAPVNLHTP